MTRSPQFSDEMWARIEPLMPRGGAKGGRPWNDHRRTVEGICWRLRTARSCGPTSTLPAPEKGDPPNYKNPRAEPADHALGHSRGGWTTKSHALVDASGHLCSLVVTPGQAGENPRLLDVIDLAPHRVVRVVADKAYSHPSTRTELRRRRIKVTIPERSDQIARRKAKGSRGGRPPAFDPTIYKGRNVVERFFNRIKEFRAIATRYDKLARNYRAGLVLASTIICLRDQLRDTP
ncbi:IS5 family transposase [Propioniciclava sp. MC1595]|uniref:IS5 family transposase n=3 Tax=unclassified Propioniciclava TaxID=2642922 RepID=UPI0037C62F78